MFKWLRKQNHEKQEDNLSHLAIQKRINEIQKLTGVTQTDFQSLYVKTIERFSDYFQSPNQPVDDTALIDLLNNTILALKRRRGYLLPLGSDSETSFREREEWTFAVFSATLLKSVDKPARLAVTKALLPQESFAWLHRNHTLFTLWERFLKGDEKKNVFVQIVGQDEAIQAIEETEIVYSIKPTPTVNVPLESKSNTLKQTFELPEDAVIQEIDLSCLSSKNDKVSKLENNPKETLLEEATQVLPVFKAIDFWQWLKESLTEYGMEVNQNESVVHRVKEGLLICLPGIIDQFLKQQASLLGIETSSTVLDQRMMLTKAIKKHDALVRNAQNSRIHTYCLGRWENRHLLSGLLIKPEALLDAKTTLPVHQDLTIDPMGNA
jgi:hypothetical protein